MHKITTAVGPYLYAGAVRAATTQVTERARAAVAQAIANEHPDIAAFLASPWGDALLRLALAGAAQMRPTEGLTRQVISDLQQELLVSASAAGIDGLIDAIEQGGRALLAKRGGE